MHPYKELSIDVKSIVAVEDDLEWRRTGSIDGLNRYEGGRRTLRWVIHQIVHEVLRHGVKLADRFFKIRSRFCQWVVWRSTEDDSDTTSIRVADGNFKHLSIQLRRPIQSSFFL